MTAAIRCRVQLRIGVWRRALLDVEDARRRIDDFVNDPHTRDAVVDLIVGRVPAWPDLAEYDRWPDETPSWSRVPAEWVSLVRHASTVIVVGDPAVLPGWRRLLDAAVAAAA